MNSNTIFLFISIGDYNLFLFLQDQLRKSRDRVEELEVAIKESVSITAEREELLSKEGERRHKIEKQVCFKKMIRN